MQKVASAAHASHELIGASVGKRDAALAGISEIGRVSLVRFARFVVAYNVAVTVWDANVCATGSGAVLTSADQLLATHHSGVTLSRKKSTAANWSLAFKTMDHISRRGGPSS